MERKTLVMLAAGALVVYAMLRSSNAAAAPTPSDASTLEGMGGGGGGGGGGSIFESLGNAIGGLLDAGGGGSSTGGGGSSTGPQGSDTPGPLPVAVTTVQDAPRVDAAVSSTSEDDDYARRRANVARVKMENTD